jgi:hypothetical protein
MKFIVIFLLIAGAFATEEDEDDLDFNAEAEEAEDYDEVDEEEDVEERDLETRANEMKDDFKMLPSEGKSELEKFCAENDGDGMCEAMGL